MTSRRWRLSRRLRWLPQPPHKIDPKNHERADRRAAFKRRQAQFERIVIDLIGSLRSGDDKPARSVLAPNVVWQGLRPEWRCEGATAVLDGLREGLANRRDISGIEVLRGENSVIFGSQGSSLDAIDDEPLGGQIYNVYTFADERVIRIQDVLTRAEALELAGIADPPTWR